MRKIISVAFVCIIYLLANAQQKDLTQHYFECYGNNTSIPLPSDFLGPKYFPYEGGSIIDFYTEADTCVVSILCGESGNLKLDDTYKLIEEISAYNSMYYYSEQKNKYARKIETPEYILMYDYANKSRKEVLDRLFDLILKKY